MFSEYIRVIEYECRIFVFRLHTDAHACLVIYVWNDESSPPPPPPPPKKKYNLINALIDFIRQWGCKTDGDCNNEETTQ